MTLGRAGALLADGRWHFGIGDPNVMAWVTVVAYAIASGLAIMAVISSLRAQRALAVSDPVESSKQKSLKRFWFLVAAVLVFLGVNKQLDLQSLFTQIVRDRAVANGWYDNRREYQLDFIVGITLIGMLMTLLLAIGLRKVLHRVLGAVLGMAMLVVFVIIRASSFHYVDVLIYRGTIHLNWVLEIGGITIVAFSAMNFVWKTRRLMRERAMVAPADARTETGPAGTGPNETGPDEIGSDEIGSDEIGSPTGAEVDAVSPADPQRR